MQLYICRQVLCNFCDGERKFTQSRPPANLEPSLTPKMDDFAKVLNGVSRLLFTKTSSDKVIRKEIKLHTSNKAIRRAEWAKC